MLSQNEITEFKNIFNKTKLLKKLSKILCTLEEKGFKDTPEFKKYSKEYENIVFNIKNTLVELTQDDPKKCNELNAILFRSIPNTSSKHYDFDELNIIFNEFDYKEYRRLIYFIILIINFNMDFSRSLSTKYNEIFDEEDYKIFLSQYSLIERDKLLVFLRLLDVKINETDNKQIKNELLKVKYDIAFLIPTVENELINQEFNTDNRLMDDVDITYGNNHRVESYKGMIAREKIIALISRSLIDYEALEDNEALKIKIECFIRANLLFLDKYDLDYVIKFIECYKLANVIDEKELKALVEYASHIDEDRELINKRSYSL